MILVDTNVVSEPLRVRPDPGVAAWLDAQSTETLFLATMSLAELLLGVERLPAGRRRALLAAQLRDTVMSMFDKRIVAFDADAAVAYGHLVARAAASGHPIGVADGQIAAIASIHGFSVATRDRTPFLACGLTVIDPFRSIS